MFTRREPVQIDENISLSIQAGKRLYCSPRVDGLEINEYEEVELAILQKGVDGFPLPSALGVDGFDSYFEPGNHRNPVAAYVPVAVVLELISALKRRSA